MGIGKSIRRLFGLRRLTLRDLAILLLTLLFLGLLVTFAVMKILESIEKYNIKYYEPKDFQRGEVLKQQEKK